MLMLEPHIPEIMISTLVFLREAAQGLWLTQLMHQPSKKQSTHQSLQLILSQLPTQNQTKTILTCTDMLTTMV